MHGWIILDKPSGRTCIQAAGRVKRLTGQKKIGHAGTLDPLASGVLPLALGEATKTMPYMVEGQKTYHFRVQWGEERNTDDSEGEVTASSPLRPQQSQVAALLPRFTGPIMQVPPQFSAIFVNGRRAYAAARAGEAVALNAREVVVDSLNIIEHTDAYTDFALTCEKGTYVRSIARDLGRELGCFGHVSCLRRTRVGKFSETAAISLEKLEEMVHKGAPDFLLPVESALDDILASLQADSMSASRLKRGQAVDAFHTGMRVSEVEAKDGQHFRLMQSGRLLAICELQQGFLQPVRVFNY